MKLSLQVAISENGIIGKGLNIPWKAKGEQLLFKAITFNQWLLVGRKTFESMGILPNRKYAVLTRSDYIQPRKDVLVFPSIEKALKELPEHINHLIVAGGGEVFRSTIDKVDTIHLSTIHQNVNGDVSFPAIPKYFKLVFQQEFESNINYTYQILQKGLTRCCS